VTAPVQIRRLPDGREVRTIEHHHGDDCVQLHTSSYEGAWLWSFTALVGSDGRGAYPFPGRRHEPLQATEADALRCAAKAALAHLAKSPKAPRTLKEWLEGLLKPTQAQLFGGQP